MAGTGRHDGTGSSRRWRCEFYPDRNKSRFCSLSPWSLRV